jgi:hypothetical protein
MTFRIDDDEMEVLAGDNNSRLSHEAKLVYLLGIRPYMDYETGLVGFKRVVSYQSIREVLEYAPPKGSTKKAQRYEKEAIRAIFKELERAGLILWVKNEDRGLFFECLKALRGKRTEIMNNPWTTPEQPQANNPKNNPEEFRNDAATQGNEQPQEPPVADLQHMPKNNPPPESGIRDKEDSLRSSSSAQKKGKKSTQEVDPEFERAWSSYPKRAGGNSKQDALKAWRARLKEGHLAEEMRAGIERYQAYCEAVGNIGTQFVKQTETFLGTGKHFQDEWAIPKQKAPTAGKQTSGPSTKGNNHEASQRTYQSVQERIRQSAIRKFGVDPDAEPDPEDCGPYFDGQCYRA